MVRINYHGKHLDAVILGILGCNGKVTGVNFADPKNGGIRTVSPDMVKPYLRTSKRVKAIRARKYR